MNLFGLFRRFREPRPDSRSAAPFPALPEPAAAQEEAPPSHPPEVVRRLLFDAVAAGDERRLEDLCREHQDLILRSGPAWLEVPEAFRASPGAYEWYGNGLRALARYCADKVGGAGGKRVGDGGGDTVPSLDAAPDAATPTH